MSIKHFPIFFQLLLAGIAQQCAFSQQLTPFFQYKVSILQPESHAYTVTLHTGNWDQDTVVFKMPNWMPGYYQIMSYGKSVENMTVTADNGEKLAYFQKNDHSWAVYGVRNRPFRLEYRVKTERQFVATSYVDTARAYIIPENSFLYVDGQLATPATVQLDFPRIFDAHPKVAVATGLAPLATGSAYTYRADNFDILYDCPLLIGDLQELPPFEVQGRTHRFIGYNMGNFDGAPLMDHLKKIVTAAADIFGPLPYTSYTFIGIGPGRGGIEHLNNTTISFDGNGLNTAEGMQRVLNFIAHEYFHHYNVKRIRPFELGPFDYEHGNRTNLLWISEGLTVYYEYMIVKRAGLADGSTFLANFAGNIAAFENNPGKDFQSLQQASYHTWSDGPFGTQGNERGKTISYYDKGPIVGLLLDLEIRNATQNKQSLDDIMCTLYRKYYLEAQRGFTEAEFQFACEQVAGKSLSNFFEYVYTAKPLDYDLYLSYAGLKLTQTVVEQSGKEPVKKFTLDRIANPTALQSTILKSWMGE